MKLNIRVMDCEIHNNFLFFLNITINFIYKEKKIETKEKLKNEREYKMKNKKVYKTKKKRNAIKFVVIYFHSCKFF